MEHPLSQKAKEALGQAKKEAEKIENNYIGSEHILLGIIEHRNNSASKILQSLSVDPERLKIKILEKASWGRKTLEEEFTLTSRARRIFEKAMEECRRLGKTEIGTEHIILGLLAEGEGIAARTLIQDFKLNREDILTKLKEENLIEISEEELAASSPIEEMLAYIDKAINISIQYGICQEAISDLKRGRDKVYIHLIQNFSENKIKNSPFKQENSSTEDVVEISLQVPKKLIKDVVREILREQR